MTEKRGCLRHGLVQKSGPAVPQRKIFEGLGCGHVPRRGYVDVGAGQGVVPGVPAGGATAVVRGEVVAVTGPVEPVGEVRVPVVEDDKVARESPGPVGDPVFPPSPATPDLTVHGVTTHLTRFT